MNGECSMNLKLLIDSENKKNKSQNRTNNAQQIYLSDDAAMQSVNEEIESAWKEKELIDAEKAYYHEQQISNEIQQAWIEKEMLEDGYSTEEIEEAMSDDWNLYEENEYDNETDEYDEDNEPEIDNTDLSYENKYVYICLNHNEGEIRNRLKQSQERLCKKFSNIREIQSENKLQTILDNEFRDGFSKNIYIRNLTFEKKNGREIQILAIRPELVAGDYLMELLPEGITLIFRGHVRGREFVVDDIYDTADTEQLDFEAFASVIPRSNPNDVKYNFFYDILENAYSLAEYTGERLEEWKEYLKWHRQICIRQVYGFKYYRFQYDAVKKQVVFWLVCKDEAYFKERKRYLSRDIQVFDNDYSENEWIFEFVSKDDGRHRFSRHSIELGRFRGVKDSYYLKKENADNNIPEEELFVADDEKITDSSSVRSSNKILTENDVLKAFDTPYVVKVAYELPRDIKDKIQDLDFISEEEGRIFVEENYLVDFSPNGFLALSAVGDLTLIKRFERAIQSLERDECYSPNLAIWLFNIAQARLPEGEEDIQIEHWLNPNIAENENQKTAVKKMIAAPDICLVQGPPGTGKTTVIAEAIYQLVTDGNRVLVASQSNDAVDNALERLADRPEIRAIRLGQKSRRKRNIDLNKRKFSEDEALKYYYQSLSIMIKEKWLDQWEKLEGKRIDCRKDARDVQNYQQDIAEYQKELNQVIAEMQNLQRKRNSIENQIQQTNQQNARILDAKQKAHSYENILNGISDSMLFLTERQLRIAEQTMNPIIRNAQQNGIQLSLQELNLEEQGTENESEFLRIIIKRLSMLKNICKKLVECGQQSAQNESSIAILLNRRDEIRSQMADAAEEDDMETVALLRRQLNDVKSKIESANGSGSMITLADSEKQILSDKLSSQIISGNVGGIRDKMELIIRETEKALQQSLSEIIADTEKLQTTDITELEEQLKATESRLSAKQHQMQETSTALKAKQSILTTLSEKYQTSAHDNAAILNAITQTIQNIEKKLSDSEPVRRQWESVLKEFDTRLNDEQAFSCDQQYYQPIYVNSCNVVGISCTDNMRALTDNGYDDFDVVIIDEVSKATPPELLIPLMKARKAILVGDHRQLPPMFKEHEHSYNDLISDQESIPEELQDLMTTQNFRRFKNMVTSSLFKEYFERADESIRHSLLVQYRMHSDIMGVINRFYENRLENGLSSQQEAERKAHNLTIRGADGSEFIIPSKHAYWLDSSVLPNGTAIYDSKSNPATKNEGGTSVYNTLEQYMIIELLKKMADSWRKQYQKDKIKKTVGIISFYQAQVNRIRELFRDVKRSGFDFSSLDIEINTVDRFQGKEKNVIITSLVTNSPKGWASKHVITFERINVAFSRAQQLLVVVGAKHTYEKQKIELPNMNHAGTSTVSVYQNIMEEMHRKGCFKGSEKLITPELESKIWRIYQGGDDE